MALHGKPSSFDEFLPSLTVFDCIDARQNTPVNSTSRFGRNVCTRLSWRVCARVLLGPAKLNCPPGLTPLTSGKPVGWTVEMSLSEYLPKRFQFAEKRWSMRPSSVEASCGRTGEEAKLVTL